jgi:hypothetical protein
MAASRGINGKALTLEIDGVAYEMDLTAVTMKSEDADADTVTFTEAAAGGDKQFYFEGTAIQSVATASFWRHVWANVGQDVAFIFAPEGNATPTADSPHFTGTCTILNAGDLGAEASSNGKQRSTFDFRFDIIGTPVLEDGVV